MSELETCLDRALLAKGIGPKGLRPLGEEDLAGTLIEIAEQKHPHALAATFVMAFQVLERDPLERKIFDTTFSKYRDSYCCELVFLFEIFQRKAEEPHESWLIKLASREDLDEDECRQCVDRLLDPSFPVAYKAALLQGLRVKRESDAENLVLYSRLFELAPRLEIENLDRPLVDWSDPYDGMNRHANLGFLGAVVLSALGVPVVIHSASGLGPKYGKTVLDELPSTRPLGLKTGALALQEVGLAVLDQDVVFPELSRLKPMRNEMRKRPFLATVEKMLMPLRSKGKNILITGYVHKAYKESIPKMVMDQGGFDAIFLVKGVEGSVLLDPSKKIPAIFSDGKRSEELEMECHPRSNSPKSELNACEISDILTGKDDRWDALKFTVSKILEIALGEDEFKGIIGEMSRFIDEKLFLTHLSKVRDFYNCSGDYA